MKMVLESTLCIPKLYKTYKEMFVTKCIEQSKLGYVKRYTEIPWKYDETNKRVIFRIHWNQSNPYFAQNLERLNSGENIKLVFGYPQMWHIYLAKN